MTKRIMPPADYNDTSETFARSLHGCRREDFADDAAAHWYGLMLVLALLALLLGLCLLALTIGGADAAATNPPPLKAIPQGVCPPGHVGAWVDGATVQCFKELEK